MGNGPLRYYTSMAGGNWLLKEIKSSTSKRINFGVFEFLKYFLQGFFNVSQKRFSYGQTAYFSMVFICNCKKSYTPHNKLAAHKNVIRFISF